MSRKRSVRKSAVKADQSRSLWISNDGLPPELTYAQEDDAEDGSNHNDVRTYPIHLVKFI